MSIARRALHGDFGRIALLEMDRSLVRHVHSECHVLLKATGENTCFSVGGRLHELTERTAVLVSAGEPHDYVHRPGAAPTLILALYIEPRWLAMHRRSLRASAHPSFFPDPSVTLTPAMRRLSQQLVGEMLTSEELPRERLEPLLFELLVLIFERHSDWRHLSRHPSELPVRSAPPFDARVRRANAIMLERLPARIDMQWLARECGLSRSQFFALYRQHTRTTPQMFVNMRRMQLACEWLSRDRRRTLADLSETLGFSEQAHFTRFFQRHLGAAPSQYRRVLDWYDPGER